MFGLITLPLVTNYALLGWAKNLRSSKCWWGRCVQVMRAVFRMCGNESQPGLQLVEKLTTPRFASADGMNRAFSLTWLASMQIYGNKRTWLHKKRDQLPQDWFGTPTWPPWHHVKTLYRPFARWHHFTTKTRILQGFAFLCKLGLLLFKPHWDYKI